VDVITVSVAVRVAFAVTVDFAAFDQMGVHE
jgi:hypothetical protein